MDDHLQVLLSIIRVPFVLLSTYEDKGRKPWTGYAAVLHGSHIKVENWCHVVSAAGVSPWHQTEADAWECFDKNHPGVREAIAWAESEAP